MIFKRENFYRTATLVGKLQLLAYFETWMVSCQKHTPKVFYKKTVLKNFAIFTGKNLCWSLLTCKRLQRRCFLVNIVKYFRRPILKAIYERHSWIKQEIINYQTKLFILVKRLRQNLRHNQVYEKFAFRSHHKSIFKTTANYTIVNLICWYNNYNINH